MPSFRAAIAPEERRGTAFCVGYKRPQLFPFSDLRAAAQYAHPPFAMNSTFKVTPAGAQFNIIQYTAPPPSKPRRPQGSQRREAIPERCSLPDLAPNSLFDDLDGLQAQSGIPDSVHAPSLDDVYEISSPSTPDAGIVDLNLAGKNTFTNPTGLPQFLGLSADYIPFVAAERPDSEVVPEESALNEIDEPQQSTSGRTSRTDLGVLHQRNPSLSMSIPVATSNLGK